MNFLICAYFVVLKKRLKINLEKKFTLQNPIFFASIREITIKKNSFLKKW